MRGRPRDPARGRRRTGHRGKPGEPPRLRFAPPAEPGPPEPPEDLPEGAKALWGELAPHLPPGLRGADLILFRMLSVAAHRAARATAGLERYGEVVRGTRGPMLNPLARLERDATQAFLRLSEELGLTFASRLRLGVVELQGKSVLHALHEDLERGV